MEGQNLKFNLESLQKKAKERTVKTQQVEYDLDTLVKRIKKGSIKLDPDYQRRHRWDSATSSRLIESLILNIPIPVIFISQDIDVDDEVEDSTSRYTVIDGQQRLTAIYDFMLGKFSLDGLDTLSELNGCAYGDLPPFLTRRLEERTIRCLRIDSTVDAQVKYDIFERLNTGSVRLESQELRNATARGAFNDLTKELGSLPLFRKLIQISDADPLNNPKVRKMEDAELVLRFFALSNGGYERLKKGFKEFLTTSLVEFNKLSEDERNKCKSDFLTYISFIDLQLKPQPFSKVRFEGAVIKRMSSFNAAVYDAVLIGLSESFTSKEIEERPEIIASKVLGYETLFADPEFFAAVTGSVNDAAKVNLRISKMKEYFLR
ncbi:DUF262 domain-containing protein [Rahnella aceris]|uniref:DUF262 domain-containing protein n=1 Tax=Rahnella sp. (strain Y9602) TaxID=2703885 RepID=UPI001F52DD7D|nr:DUF262 domain-containing protein [Rahnella aceris]UNK53052.1 DUF262 domain-containing protein [Rahnella aceris]